jgi:glycerophosphoryl diester phosphodiesterase
MVKNHLPSGKTRSHIVASGLPLIIAHRGSSYHSPENTIAAFRAAIEAGADGIEFDVRLAKNDTPVVFHDRTLKRVAGSNAEVAELDAAELASVSIGGWFNRMNPAKADDLFGGEGVPTLGDTLAYLKPFEGRIYVELKCKEADARRTAECVAAEIARRAPAANLVVKSFKLGAISRVRQLLPGVRTAALFAPKIRNVLRKQKYLVDIASDLGTEEISLHYSLATRKLVAKALERGMQVAVWTADNPRWVKRARELGIGSIITNDPARLIAHRSTLD